MSLEPINIVIPMAGRGSRFAEAGYDVPKPLIEIGGRPMIEWVVENVRPQADHRFHFICLQEHFDRYAGIRSLLEKICPGCTITTASSVTEGAACTILLASEHLNNNSPLVIANSDQIIQSRLDDHLKKLDQADGVILTFEADDPKWSYCRLSADNKVTEVVEKQVVSNCATVGIYIFRRGSDFIYASDRMIAENKRVNGEFYVAPAYNELIATNKVVLPSSVGTAPDTMLGIGVPEDLNYFLSTEYFANHSRLDRYAQLAQQTRTYIWAFDNQRMDAISNLLDDNFCLTDPSGTYRGKAAALQAIKQIFAGHPQLRFTESRLAVDAVSQRSVIDFQLKLNDGDYTGFDFIQWRGHRIEELSAHLTKIAAQS